MNSTKYRTSFESITPREKAVEVVERRELAQHGHDRRAHGRFVPGEDPEEQQQDEGAGRGDHLAVGERRDEQAAGDAGPEEEHRAEVARDERHRVEWLNHVDDRGIQQRSSEEDEEHQQAGDELPDHDLAVAQRVRVEELDGAEPPLLGEKAHGEQRHDDQEIEADVVDEEVLPEVLEDVHPEAEGHVAVERGVELVAGDGEERADHDVDERAGEVGRQLLADERDRLHAAASRSSRTRRTKRSSRLIGSGRISSSPHPLRTTVAASSRRTASPPAERATAVTTPSAAGSSRRSSIAGHRPQGAQHRRARSVDAEAGLVGAAQPAGQPFGGVLGDDAAVVDDDDALARHAHLGKDVGAQENRRRAGERPDQRADLDDLPRIEADRRLVEHQHARPVDDRLRDPDPLAVSLRELADQLARDLGEAARREHLVDAAGALAGGYAFHLGAEREETSDRQVRIQDDVLGQVADALAHRERLRPRRRGRRSAPGPSLGGKNPVRTRMIVVLPDPFGPSRPMISPFATEKLTPATARVGPKSLTRFSTAITEPAPRLRCRNGRARSSRAPRGSSLRCSVFTRPMPGAYQSA